MSTCISLVRVTACRPRELFNSLCNSSLGDYNLPSFTKKESKIQKKKEDKLRKKRDDVWSKFKTLSTLSNPRKEYTDRLTEKCSASVLSMNIHNKGL